MPGNTILIRDMLRVKSHRLFIPPSPTHPGSVELTLQVNQTKMYVDAMVIFMLDQQKIQEANQLKASRNCLNGNIKQSL